VLRFQIIRILQITVTILLIGRGWQHLFWDAPYQQLFTAQAGFSDWFVGQWTAFTGWFYVLGIVFALTLDNRDSKWGYTFVVHSATLLLLAQMYRAANNCEWPTLLLYASQIATPLIYYQLQFTKVAIGRIMGTLKLSLTLTMLGYAWYAFGWHYGQKASWHNGLQSIFGLSEDLTTYLLIALGVVELLIVLVLWVKPLQKVAFAGILFWGLLLMLASVALFFMEHPHWQSGIRSAWELLCLLPNAGLSFAIWTYVNVKKKEENF